MADLPISSAPSLTHSTIAEGDLFPVVDISATTGSKGSRITLGELTTTVNGAMLGSPNFFTVNGAASAPAISLTGSIFTGGTSTTTKPAFLIEPAGTLSTGWSANGTMLGVNSPAGFTGKLLDLQQNGNSFTYIDSTGLYVGMPDTSGWQAKVVSNWGNLASYGWFQTYVGASSPAFRSLGSSGEIVWFSMANDNEASVMALREGAAAHTFRIYGTHTDSSNYERLSLITTAGAYSIKPEAAGTGMLRDLSLGNSGSWTMIQSTVLQLGGASIGDIGSVTLVNGGGVLQLRYEDANTPAPLDAGSYAVGGVSGASGTATSANTLTIVGGIITGIS